MSADIGDISGEYREAECLTAPGATSAHKKRRVVSITNTTRRWQLQQGRYSSLATKQLSLLKREDYLLPQRYDFNLWIVCTEANLRPEKKRRTVLPQVRLASYSVECSLLSPKLLRALHVPSNLFIAYVLLRGYVFFLP
jgi:hypothetical protein